jgi:hypothetical protein
MNKQIVHVEHVTNYSCLPSKCLGKWYVSIQGDGSDGYPVYRYLQANGCWGNFAYYFNSEDEINIALSSGEQPDFSLDNDELISRFESRLIMKENANDDL